MKKYKIGMIGYYANGLSKAGGQEAKTWAITEALQKIEGKDSIFMVDTLFLKKNPFKLLIALFSLLFRSKNIIMLPAQNSVKIFIPFFVFFNFFFHRKLHYAVVGGWLPGFLKKHKRLIKPAKKLNGVYVETNTMKKMLEEMGFDNVYVLPNFKDLPIIDPKEILINTEKPFKLCTFSRVMEEKGVEDAIDAVCSINKKYGETIFCLDIYGKLDDGYVKRFEKIKENMPNFVRYCGMVEPNESTNILKNYTALLFPTFYEGEGFAGTLLDAFSAGVPIVASDWRYNSEIIQEYKTGLIHEAKNVAALEKSLEWILRNFNQWTQMKSDCLIEAQKYKPENAIKILWEKLV